MRKRYGVVVVSVTVLTLLALFITQGMAGMGRGGRERAGAPTKLDGSSWWVTLQPQGEKPMMDVLVFEKEMFDSLACHQYGFGKGRFTGSKGKAGPAFTATTKSAVGDMMEWKGEVTGDSIAGAMKMTPKSGPAQEFTFKGSKHKPSGLLDRMSFKGEMKPGEGKAVSDTFKFEKGMFDSVACQKYGFGRGAYHAKKEGNTIKFAAYTTSPKEGTMYWMGEVMGDKVTGTTMWWPMKGGKGEKYTFSGMKGKLTY